MQEITLQLSIAETNIVLEALGQLPYVKSYALINNIQQQATRQLNGQISQSGEIVREEETEAVEA